VHRYVGEHLVVEVFIPFGELDNTIQGQYPTPVIVPEYEQVLVLGSSPADNFLYFIGIPDRCERVLFTEDQVLHS